MWVKHLLEAFPLLQFPVRVDVEVAFPNAVISIVVVTIAVALLIAIVLPLAFTSNAIWKTCLEGTVLCNVLEY